MRLVLLGPPGAGKGTQARLLIDRLEVPYISSGDLFRYHLREQTPLGVKAGGYINQGLLVPDEVTIGIILEKVAEVPPESGFILDGFPRTREQAQALEDALKDDSPLDRAVNIDVDEEELVRRLGGRFICRECQTPYTFSDAGESARSRCDSCGGELYQRDDDTPEAVRKRIEVYQEETLPVLDFYRERGLLAEIPGVGSVESIHQRIMEALGTAGSQQARYRVE